MGKTAGWLLGLGLALGAGCEGDDIYVMSEIYELDGSERIFSGGGCAMGIQDERFGGSGESGSSLAAADDDFVVIETARDGRYTVVVSSGDEELARREYGKSELLSGDEDRFQVETLAGRRYELAYWGGRDCDTSHVPDDE